MGLGKTYSTKYLLDSNNSSGVAGQVLSTTSTGIDWVDANTVPGTGLWIQSGNDIYNSNSGKVGIGTTNPVHKLTVNAPNDTTAVGIDFPSAHFDFSANSTSGYTTSFHMDDTATTIGSNSAGRALIFQTNNADRLYINGNTGNVGIGTTSPGATLPDSFSSTTPKVLQMSSTGTSTDSGVLIRRSDNATGIDIWNDGSNGLSYIDNRYGSSTGDLNFRVQTNGTPKTVMTITGDEKIGIGTTSPTANLHISDTADAVLKIEGDTINSDETKGPKILLITDNGYRTAAITGGNATYETSSGNFNALNLQSKDIRFHTGTAQDYDLAVERMRITGTGALSFGSTGTAYGTSGQILKSNGNASPTWVAASTVIGGPYLPLSAGSSYPLTGDLYIDEDSLYLLNASNNYWRVQNNSSGKLVFKQGTTQRGIWSSGELQLANNLIVDSNVGIGTTSPGTALQVGGLDDGSNYDITIGWNAVSSQAVGTKRSALTFKTSQTAVNNEDIYKWDIAMVTAPATASNEPFGSNLAFLRSTRSSTSVDETTMILTQSGNVGIGTDNPANRLVVETSTAGDYAALINNTHSTTGYGLLARTASTGTSAYALAARAASSDIFVVRADGNVGIGTTSPGAKLEISHGGINNGLLLENTLNSSNYQIALNIRENEGLIFQRWIAGAFNGNLMRIGYTGAITFDAYNSTNNTGTPTYLLGTDGSGNVVKTLSTPGGDPGPYLPLAGGTMNSGAAITFVVPSTGGNFINIDHTGNENWSFGAQSGTGVDDYIDIGINGGTRTMSWHEDGKVGINTTSPEEKLHVIGSTLISNNEFYKVEGTTGTNYKIAGLTNGNVIQIGAIDYTSAGTIFAGGDNISITTGGASGSTRMKIDSSGNVGIGTTSPGTLHSASYGFTRLHIDGGTDRGQMIIEGDSFAGIVLSDNGATANQRVFVTSVDETKYTIKPLNDNGTSTVGGVAFTVLHSGNVGIGTTNPTNKLHIQGSQTTVYSPSDSGGQASAGTTINNTNTAGNTNNFSQLLFTVGTNNNSVSRIVAIRSGSDASDLAFVGKSTAGVAEYMRIKSGGNVGIGVDNPSALLEVRKGTISGQIAKFSAVNAHVVIESSTAGNAVLHLKPNQTGSKSGQFKVTAGNGYNFRWSNDASGTGEIAYMDLDTSTTGGGDLTVKGDVIAYGSPSDKKYKENIKPIESALDKAMQLQGVTFDWKDSESILEIKEDIGFIAQDVQEVLPELVRDNGKGNLSLRYQGITPILLEAIKELKAEIEELKLNNCNCNK